MKRIPRIPTCRHFNGMQNTHCEVGQSYEEVGKVAAEGRLGFALRLPCTRPMQEAYPCLLLHRFTDEEVAAREAEQDAFVKKVVKAMNTVRPMILEDIGEARMGRDVRGSIPCPICKTGMVNYRRCGSYNGHVHAACTTDGCITWGE